MKNYELEVILNGLKGRNITFQEKQGKLMRWDIKEKTLRLITDQTDIIILSEDVPDAILQINDNSALLPQLNLVDKISMIGRINTKLETILMENIELVRKDKSHISQSQEVNSNVRSLIDLAKTEIEYMKTLAYFHKK